MTENKQKEYIREMEDCHIENHDVTNNKTKDFSIPAEEIADNAINYRKIQEETIEGSNNASGAVTVENHAPDAIDESNIIFSDIVVDMDDMTGDVLVSFINNGDVVDAEMDEAGDINFMIEM